MDTLLIILCFILSTSLAAPQQYVPPVPPGNPQLPNPTVSFQAPAQLVEFSSNQPIQGKSPATEPVQQDLITSHKNQAQSSFGLQATQNNQVQPVIIMQQSLGTNNKHNQNIQNGSGNLDNANNNVNNIDFVSGIGNENGQIMTSNIGFNNDLNNPRRVFNNDLTSNSGNGNQQATISSIGLNNGQNNPSSVFVHKNDFTSNYDNINQRPTINNTRSFSQGPDNQGLTNAPHVVSNGTFNHIVDTNNSMELLVQENVGEQHLSGVNNQYINGNVEFDTNTQGLVSSQNRDTIENNHFISTQVESTQNNVQLFPLQHSNTNQNINNNAQAGTFENSEFNNESKINESMQNTDNDYRNINDKAITVKQNDKVNNRCGRGLIPNAHGSCVHPEVTRNIFVYSAPKIPNDSSNTSLEVPRPKIEYNLVFVKAEDMGNVEPLIVPPPQQKTLVYVLSKKKSNGAQEIIEVPAGPKHNPEVFYVNYEEGDNPTLPGGIALQTALDTSALTAQAFNDVPSYPLAPEDKSHDNVVSTANAGSRTDGNMNSGIDHFMTSEGNLANTHINIPNNDETQYNHNSNTGVQTITGVRHGTDFINNNGVELNFDSGIASHSFGDFDGPPSPGIIDENPNNLNSNEGVRSIIRVSSETDFKNNVVGPNINGGLASHSVGSLDGQSSTGNLVVPVGVVDQNNGINTRSAPFGTNGDVPNFGRAIPSPLMFYNTY